jgi:hypothetical protein
MQNDNKIDLEAWKDLLLDRELRELDRTKLVRYLMQERDALEKERNDLRNQLDELQQSKSQ